MRIKVLASLILVFCLFFQGCATRYPQEDGTICTENEAKRNTSDVLKVSGGALTLVGILSGVAYLAALSQGPISGELESSLLKGMLGGVTFGPMIQWSGEAMEEIPCEK